MSQLTYNDLEKVILEITKKELDEKTFDVLWDEIRKVYKEEDYELSSHEITHDGMIIEFILFRRKIKQIQLQVEN